MISAGYWPWWLGALALACTVIGYRMVTGRPLGVSALLARGLRWREEREVARAEAELDDPEAFEAALLQATREELGGRAHEDLAEDPDDQPLPVLERQVPRRLPVSEGVTFLVMMVVGGFLSALGSGDVGLHSDLGAEFVALFGDGWYAVAALVVGGVLVGFGTSMAGGCTSGHGLDGCARRQPGSIAATVTFLAAGIVVSLLIGGVLR